MISIETQIQTLSTDSLNIIYADPPWSYKQKVGNGVLKRKDGTLIYPSMSMQQLKDLGPEVERITKDDAALFMWATMPLIAEALDLIKAWGFKYKTCFVNWVKTTKDGSRPAFGVGYYTRSNAELCLVAIKGKIASYKIGIPDEPDDPEDSPNTRLNFLTLLEDSPTPVVMTPRREHSRKPVVVREMITTLLGDLPRVEFFARETAHGWTSMGNDINHFEQSDEQSEEQETKRKCKRPKIK
tara:strand:+ start:3478 stop:4200 length:723 start_codon:yes stop_codon:yes gene_type:complete